MFENKKACPTRQAFYFAGIVDWWLIRKALFSRMR